MADLSALTLAFSLMMYVLLDGTDLGTGMLFALFRNEDDRRRMAASILPVWDANETWLVLMAAGLIALFPPAYGQGFILLYVPLFVMLLALVARAVALEYRSDASVGAQRVLDCTMYISSFLAALSQGVMAGALLNNPARGWFSFVPLLTGAGVVLVYLLAGCLWLRWRLQGDVGQRARRLAWLFWLLLLVAMVWLVLAGPPSILDAWQRPVGKRAWLTLAVFVVTTPLLLFTPWRILPLMSALGLMASWLALLMVANYPWILPGIMTVTQAAASHESQRFVLWGYAIAVPVTLIYNSWAFWIFRGKVT